MVAKRSVLAVTALADLCSIEGCSMPSRRNSMCVKHDTRVRRYGDPHYTATERHGYSRTALYNIWCCMIARCENVSNPSYPHYGGRGITVCVRWRKSFLAFKADMADRPFEGAELERVNNNEGYNKDNCIWATHQENSNNRFYDRAGAWYNKKLNKWNSELRWNGRRYYLGTFQSKAEAIKAYKNMAAYFGRRVI